MACGCPACLTGRCHCRECREGPGIDYDADRRLVEEIRREIAIERAKIRDLRAPNIERQRVRRWGEITPPPAAGREENDHE